MQVSQIPVKQPTPFGNGAGGSYIRTVPIPSQIGITNFAASYTDGFPPLCFQPGGAPYGQDFNGLLNQITAWLRWAQGGAPISYDATFSTAIGGYPKGALLAALAGAGLGSGNYWISTVDNNTSNPDASGANWIAWPPTGGGGSSNANGPFYGVDTGAVNALAATVAPTISSYTDGQIFEITPLHTNTSTSPTINISSLGAKNIIHSDGTAILAGEIVAGAKMLMAYDSGTSKIVLLDVTPERFIAGIQTGGYLWVGTYGGTANALTGTLTPAPAGLAAGMIISGLTSQINTSSATLTLNGFGPYNIIRDDGVALVGGELSGLAELEWDGSQWRIISMLPLAFLLSKLPAPTNTYNNIVIGSMLPLAGYSVAGNTSYATWDDLTGSTWTVTSITSGSPPTTPSFYVGTISNALTGFTGINGSTVQFESVQILSGIQTTQTYRVWGYFGSLTQPVVLLQRLT